MINSYAGSFTTDGNHFVFNNYFSTLNKNFDTTDQTGRGSYTNAQMWQLAYNEYEKAESDDVKNFYKNIAAYLYSIAQSAPSEKIRNTTLAQIYAYLAQKDDVTTGWSVVTKKLGGYTSKYPYAYQHFLEELQAKENSDQDNERSEIDKKYDEEAAAKEVAEDAAEKTAESLTPTGTANITTTETTSTASTNWLWVIAAVGVGFALIFGTGSKKKKKQ